MSRTNHAKCDSCNKVVENYFKEHGWIIIKGFNELRSKSFVIAVYSGGYRHKTLSHTRLDFCGIDCLNDWFDNILPDPKPEHRDDFL